jgi:hypothetical protein
MTVRSRGGFRYFMTLTDTFSRFTFIFLLRDKTDAFSAFQRFDAQFHNEHGRHVGSLLSDMGGEFFNKDFNAYCSTHGIVQLGTEAYNPERNGVSERKNLTLCNAVRAMLRFAELPDNLWDEAILTATTTINLCPTKVLGQITPFEAYYGRKPSVAHLQAFGDIAFVHVPQERRSRMVNPKLRNRSREARFLGYTPDTQGYRLLLPDCSITTAKFSDVKFFPPETTFITHANASMPDLPVVVPVPQASQNSEIVSKNPPLMIQHSSSENESSEAEEFLDVEDSPFIDSPVDTAEDSTDSEEEEISLLQAGRNFFYQNAALPPLKDITNSTPVAPKRKSYYRRCHSDSESNLCCTDSFYSNRWYHCTSHSFASSSEVPKSFEDISNFDDKELWHECSAAEIQSLREAETWDLVPLPNGRSPIKCKWVFRLKRKADGSIDKYKARLCACGYSQVEGVDYNDVYAPVVRLQSLRMMLSICAGRNMHLHQMDVKTAFLNGKLKEEIYMRQAPGFVDQNHPDYVYRLDKAIYGLKQAPREWHLTIDEFLKSHNFLANPADPCLYYRWSGSNLALVSLYVDDLGIACDSQEDLLDIKKLLSGRFKMTDLGELEFILGIEVLRDRDARKIYMRQGHYIDELLVEYGLNDCNPVTTPMECETVSAKDCPKEHTPEWDYMQTVPYRQAVGSLMYLMLSTRPDIAFAVVTASRFVQNPGRAHWNLVKRIFKYLRGTQHLKLRIGGGDGALQSLSTTRNSNVQGHSILKAQSDSDWAGNVDTRKSTTGYVLQLGGGIVSYRSKGQPFVSDSSAMAEYVAAYDASHEIVWARNFLSAMGLLDTDVPTVLETDNKAAVSIAKYHMITPKTKHFDLKLHYLREQVDLGQLRLKYVPSNLNTADIFTKPLASKKFIQFRGQLGLEEA